MKKIIVLFITLTSLSQLVAMQTNAQSRSNNEWITVELIDAVLLQDLDLVKKTMEVSEDLNYQDENGFTALMHAIYALCNLSKKYPKDVPNDWLEEIYMKNNVDSQTLFLVTSEKKLEIDEQIRNAKESYLAEIKAKKISAKSMYLKIAKMLIKAGANLNCKNKEEETTLTYAVVCRNLKIAKLILDAKTKFKISITDEEHQKILEWFHECMKNQNKPVVRVLGMYLSFWEIIASIWRA